MGYRNEEFYVPTLFYANDGLLLAGSCAEAESMIEVVVGMAERCGLNIHRAVQLKLGFGQYMFRTSNGLLWAIFGRMRGVGGRPGGG